MSSLSKQTKCKYYHCRSLDRGLHSVLLMYFVRCWWKCLCHQNAFPYLPTVHPSFPSRLTTIRSPAAVFVCIDAERHSSPKVSTSSTRTVTFLCHIYRCAPPTTLQFRPEKLMRQQECWAAVVVRQPPSPQTTWQLGWDPPTHTHKTTNSTLSLSCVS